MRPKFHGSQTRNGGASYLQRNIYGRNQSLRANYGNFNLNHTILIQGRTHERWEGWFAKLMGGERDDLQRCFCKSLLPPPLGAPLDQDHVAQIEVSIVFTERLVSTWYVAYLQSQIITHFGAVNLVLLCGETSLESFSPFPHFPQPLRCNRWSRAPPFVAPECRCLSHPRTAVCAPTCATVASFVRRSSQAPLPRSARHLFEYNFGDSW
jgi:hypothetical protein